MFFSSPEGWTESDERRLIAEVDALLPAGVSLEFDGRARAMLSHEIKNYALLRYDGRLELRGAAFESRRSEAYGQRFLCRALGCLLEGNIPGVRDAYLDTLGDLEERRFTNAEVASRVRVTKTPEQYAATRSGRKEAVYEALRAHDATWRAGESFHVYHRQGEGLVVLSDAGGRDYDARHYAVNLLSSYASRLRKGLRPEEYRQLFEQRGQPGLFDRPFEQMRPIWNAVTSPCALPLRPQPPGEPAAQAHPGL
ncbi:hypothetical protein [Deinococcus metallilatus]|uniref:DNA polymerase elongation subunit (Family B) n=1 Tax=Deinococcus metallilatus TaxID=1211322 RepID=A0ABR6MSJ6_9DEIO|nr:hypothetical protein [Deinococcus metallilatus]MBB5294922.1 DNA polymerase elongation subunit (family B) [Deinococcus metallilatus]GMA16851.1 hypothetical protein GCM10025871_31820 [Deinococcus metallilatus]